MDWHRKSSNEVLAGLGVDAAHGLTEAQATALRAQHGPNELTERGGRSPWRILWEQITATMVLILIAASVISGALGKWQEAIAILAIVILFALLGFLQEYRAEKAMAALKKLAVPSVRVRRDGQILERPAHDLVPGDVVLLEAGNLIPADLRLIESVNLRIQESALTGESEAIEKQDKPIDRPDLPLGDRKNMAYMGTTATYGRGTGVVIATGMKTELGNIAGLLQQSRDELTPLQKRLDHVGKLLAVAGVAIAALVAGFEIWRGGAIVDAFLVAVSVAVAVVPEGLPAVVTITLALGARRMLGRNALIRKLPAVETLGSVTTICSDKTGTLTENRMTVTVLDVAGHRADLTEETTDEGQARFDLAVPAVETPQGAIGLLLAAGALCNDARLIVDDGQPNSRRYHALGDPTEGALVVAAARFGLHKHELDAACVRVAELPFDSERKRMTTVHVLDYAKLPAALAGISTFAGEAKYIAFTKGAIDGLLEVATHVWVDGRREPLTNAYRERIERANRGLAENGMRVLGAAFRIRDTADVGPEIERDLTIVGFTGIIDPPRAEVKDAVARCRSAGIRPVMITGDHPLTALHIARQLGIAGSDSRAMSGTELNAIDDAQLDRVVESISVFARVSPEHKLRIVNALGRRGHITAMTGDGVNDAPALKAADIGVAMGITGTDVSKEAAKMVLRDDNFSTIVAAVEEGRVIYDNLRKFIKFSIGGNIGKIVVMLGGVLGGMTTPLLPLQLLWLNLLTDGLLGIGLGVEPAERNVMQRKPFSPNASIFSDGVGGQIVRVGLLIAALSLGVGFWYFLAGRPEWQTMMFMTLAFGQVFQAFGTRTGSDSLLRAGLFGNRLLLLLGAIVVALQIAAVYVPALAGFLRTTPLSAGDLMFSFGLGAIVLVYTEVEKAIVKRLSSR